MELDLINKVREFNENIVNEREKKDKKWDNSILMNSYATKKVKNEFLNSLYGNEIDEIRNSKDGREDGESVENFAIRMSLKKIVVQ